jgi:hypothetical protein
MQIKKLKFPYINTSIETDIILTLFLAPFWWVLGINLLIYHLISFWLLIKVLLICAKQRHRIEVPFQANFLMLFILIYGLSLLINLPQNDSMRTIASLYNYSFWIMGFFLILAIYNSRLNDLTYLTGPLSFNLFFLGILAVFSTFLWINGYSELAYKSPLLSVFGSLGEIPLLKASTTIKLMSKGWLASQPFPRFNAMAPYPTAAGGLIIVILPIVMAYYRTRFVKLKLHHWAVLGLGLFALLLTMSRTSVLALFTAVAIIYIANRRHSLAIISLVFAMSLFASPFIIHGMKWVSELRAGTSMSRLELYKYTFDTVMQKNPIIGMGAKPRIGDFKIPVGSHSTYLSLLFKTGFLGLLTFVAFQFHLIYTWLKVKRLKKSQRDKIVWNHIGVSLLAMSLWMLTDDLDAPQLVAFLYFILIGTMIVIGKEIVTGSKVV